MMIGLAVAATMGAGSIAQGAENQKPATPPCELGQGGQGQDCPFYGQGMGKGRGGAGMGQQHRYGQGKGQGMGGMGQGQGKGFRGGPRDGTGPKRDGSCGQCPAVKPS
jgi:hypothetical protein